MKTFLILLLAVTVASATTTYRKRENYAGNLNEYVDQVIGNLQSWIVENSHESIALPNITQSFSEKPLWITYSGRLSLYDGILTNLETVRRYGDVIITYSSTPKVLGFRAELGVDTVKVNYNYGSKLLGLTASGRVDGTASSAETSIDLSANLKEYVAILNDFSITRIGSVKAKLHGNTVTDWFANTIMKIVVPIIQDDVTNKLDDAVTKLINKSFDKVNDYFAVLLES